MSENRSSTRFIVLGFAIMAISALSVAAESFWSTNTFAALQGLFGVETAAPAQAAATNGKIVFQRGFGTPGAHMFVVDSAGTSEIDFDGGEDPSWRPDGSKIIFSFLRELWMINPDVTNLNQQPIKDAAGASIIGENPSWSPDGQKVVFIRNSQSGFPGSIYKMDITINPNGTVTGSNQVQLTTVTTDAFPAWQPTATGQNGALIAFQRSAEIFTISSTNGGNATNITNNPNADRNPNWSPDGTKIVFTSGRAAPNNGDIWKMNPDGTGLVQLTSDTFEDAYPTFSPDGTKISWSSGSGRNGTGSSDRIFVMNADGSGITGPISTSGFDTNPSWGPGGAAQVFNATLSFDGRLRDRVSKNDANIGGDGEPDGTLTMTLPAATLSKSIASVDLKGPSGNEWDTIKQAPSPSAFWVVGVARDLDTTLLNQFDGTLSSVPVNTGIFKLFIGNTTPSSFLSGKTFDLTVKFTDGSSATATTTVNQTEADVAIAFTQNPPTSVTTGDTVEFSTLITNNGPEAARGVVFTGTIDPKFQNVQVPNGLGCLPPTGNVVTCNIGDLAFGNSTAVRITARAFQSGSTTSTMQVSVDSSRTFDTPGNNIVTALPTIQGPKADLRIDTNPPPATVGVEDGINYSFVVRNNGPNPATGVKFTLGISMQATFAGITGPGCGISTGVLVCDIGNLSVGSVQVITITLSPLKPGSLIVTADITGNETDLNPGDNHVALTTQVKPRLQLVGLEVTQSVQDLKNSVPLIATKRTFIRAYVKPSNTGSADVSIGASITGSNSGTGGVTNAVLPPSNTGQTVKVIADPKRMKLEDSFYFELLGGWNEEGTLQFRFETPDALLTCAEPDGAPNCATSVTFQRVRQISMFLLSVPYAGDGRTAAKFDTARNKAIEELEAMMPTRSLLWLYGNLPNQLASAPKTKDEGGKVLDTLETMHNVNCDASRGAPKYCRQFFTGLLIKSPTGGEFSGIARMPGHAAINYMDTTEIPEAQELGHNFGLDHTDYNHQRGIRGKQDEVTFEPVHAGQPADGTISTSKVEYGPDTIFGFDVNDTGKYGPGTRSRIYGPNTPDTMSYGSNAWISAFTYKRIMKILEPSINTGSPEIDNLPLKPDGPMVAASKTVLVRGAFPMNSPASAQFKPFYVFNSPADVVLPDPGTYAIRFDDAQGQALATYSFEPQRELEAQTASFNLLLPFPTGTKTLTLLQNGQAFTSRQSSASAPTVAVLSPNGGESLNNAVTLRWSASDADGGTLSYMIDYSSDAGTTWQTLAADVTVNSYDIDLSMLAGSTQGLFRVTATDGFNTSQDQSDATFTVAKHAPAVSIISPVNNQIYVGNQTVILTGKSYDVEDGVVADPGFTWSSNLNGVLGTGNSLAINASTLQEGTHTITLTGRDSDGQTGTSSLSIVVSRTRPVFPPALSLGASNLVLNAYQGTLKSQPQELAVRNSGDGDLTWTATADQTWIKLDSTAGSAPFNLSVTADPTGMALGQYTGNITVTSPGSAGSPQVIPVTFYVTEAPLVTVSGKVVTPDNRGLRNATVSITDSQGLVRTSTTSSFGFYSFDNVLAGGTYTIRISSRLFRFAPRSVPVGGALSDIDFVGLE